MRCSRVDVCESWRLRSVTSCLRDLLGRHDPAEPQAGPERLGERVDVHHVVGRAEHAGVHGRAPEAELAVRVVGEDQEAVALGELDQPDAGPRWTACPATGCGSRARCRGRWAAHRRAASPRARRRRGRAARRATGRVRPSESSSARRKSGKIGLSTATRPPRSTSESTASDRPWNPPLVMMTRSTGTPSRAAIQERSSSRPADWEYWNAAGPERAPVSTRSVAASSAPTGSAVSSGIPPSSSMSPSRRRRRLASPKPFGLAERAGEGGDRGQGRQQVWCRRHRFCLPGGARLRVLGPAGT